MTKYADMKNADLQALLKTRGLPTAGKKADLVDRLTKDDEEKSAEPAAPAEKPAAATTEEDEIDWDDEEPAATKPSESVPTASETVAKAGGEGQASNPQAVPNQVADIDPSTTADLSVKSPVAEGEEKSEEQVEEKTEEKVEEKKEPAKDFSVGLAASSIEDEIEKRKKRAAKFGLKFDEDENLKKLEREKKFGATGPPKGLDEALPDRPLKRGRNANDQGSRGPNKRRGDKFGGRRGGGNRDGGDRRRDDARPNDRGASNSSNWMSEADKRKAEERKKKWAAASS